MQFQKHSVRRCFAITQTLFATPPHLHQRRSPMNLETPSTPVFTSRQTSRKIKKDLSLRISLIISNKTGVCARVSGFITPRVKGADYSLICLHFIIIARYRQIFLISRTRKSQNYFYFFSVRANFAVSAKHGRFLTYPAMVSSSPFIVYSKRTCAPYFISDLNSISSDFIS